MAKAFSVFVNIGGRLLPSLGSAVGQANARLSALGRSVHATNIGAQSAINRLHTGMNKAGRSMQNAGRSMTTGLTLPVALLGKVGFDFAYEFEKTSNAVQAIGGFIDEQISSLKSYAKELNALYPQTNAGIMQASEELTRAGFNYEQTTGALKGALNLSLAGAIDTASAADISTNILTAMNLPRKTAAETASSLEKVVDHLAYASNRSNTDVRQLGDAFKYVGPIASNVGGNVSDLSAAFMIMANRGVKGSEAGVAMRSAIVRMVRPTKAMLAYLARMNINIKDYVKGAREVSSTDIVKTLSVNGINAKGLTGQISKILKNPNLKNSPEELVEKLTSLISTSLGSSSIIDKEQLSAIISDSLIASGSTVDYVGFFQALKNGGADAAAMANIFDARQSARLISLLGEDNWGMLAREVREKSKGSADEMRKQRMKGIVGEVAELSAAWENLFITLGEAGTLRDLGNAFKALTSGLENLSKQNPALLRFGTWALFAIAALGPLAILGGGALRVLAPLASGILYLGNAASLGLASRLITVAGSIRTLAVASLFATARAPGRLRAFIGEMVALNAVAGKRVMFGAMAMHGIHAFGRGLMLLLSPLKLLRFAITAIGFALRFAFLASGVGAVIAGIAAAGLFIYNNWSGLTQLFRGIGVVLSSRFPRAAASIGWVTDKVSVLWNWATKLLGPIKGGAGAWFIWGQQAGKAIADALDAISDPAQWVAAGRAMMNALWEGMKNVGEAIKGWIASLGAEFINAIGLGGAAKAHQTNPGAYRPQGFSISGPDGYAGARALGGPVRANTPYLVGERGPEIFVPSAAGRVETNRTLSRLAAIGRAGDGMGAMRLAPSPQAIVQATGGGGKSVSRGDTSISINVVAQSGDGNEIARQVRRELGIILARMESEQRGMLND